MFETRKLLLALAATAGVLFIGSASAAVEGTDYQRLPQAVPTETGDRIEVLEAFSYGCPHCQDFEPVLSAWIKTLPADVQVRKLPVTFRPAWVPLAQAFYAAEALGVLPQLHEKMFDAIHKQNMEFRTNEELFGWVEKQGVDRKKYTDAFNSFGVNSKIQRVPTLMRSYAVDSVPMLIIDGQFKVTSKGSYQVMLRTASELIQLRRSQRPAVKKSAVESAPVAAVTAAPAPQAQVAKAATEAKVAKAATQKKRTAKRSASGTRLASAAIK